MRGNYVHNFTLSKSHRPVGGPWSFVMKFLGSNREKSFSFFEDNFGVRREKFAETKEVDTKNAEASDDQRITYTSETLNATLVIDLVEKTMTEQNSAGSRKIADFYIEPIAYIEQEDGRKIRLIKFTGKFDETRTVVFPNEMNAMSFSKTLRSMGLFNFTGLNNSYILIIEYINYGLHKSRLYDNGSLGINARGVFISNNISMRMGEEGSLEVIPVEENIAGDEYIHIEKEKMNLEGPAFIIPKESCDYLEGIKRCCEIYDERIMVPLILTVAVGYASRHLRRIGMKIPYGFLFGLTQTGKTTISEIVQRELFGDHTPRLAALSTTPMPLRYAVSHNKPTFIGEFKMDDRQSKEKWNDFLKNTFDGTSTQKGEINLNVRHIPSVGTLIIDGEYVVEDPATFSRGVFMHCRRSMKRDIAVKVPNIMADFYKRLWNTGLINPKSHADIRSIQRSSQAILKRDLMLSGIESGESDRVIANYSLIVTLAGLMGVDEEFMYPPITYSMVEQCKRVSRTEAKKELIHQLFLMVRSAVSAKLFSSVTIEKDGEGQSVICVHTVYLEGYIKIDKGRDSISIKSIVEALHGEDGIEAGSGRISFMTDRVKLDKYAYEIIFDTINIKSVYQSATMEEKAFVQKKAEELNIPLFNDEE